MLQWSAPLREDQGKSMHFMFNIFPLKNLELVKFHKNVFINAWRQILIFKHSDVRYSIYKFNSLTLLTVLDVSQKFAKSYKSIFLTSSNGSCGHRGVVAGIIAVTRQLAKLGPVGHFGIKLGPLGHFGVTEQSQMGPVLGLLSTISHPQPLSALMVALLAPLFWVLLLPPQQLPPSFGAMVLVLVVIVFVNLAALQTSVTALPDREQVVDVEVELPRLVLELRLGVDRLNLYD